MPAIPASAIVRITPSVIGAGGRAFQLLGLILTNSTRVPIGAPLSFPSAPAVASYFGPGSPEAQAASIYFLGFQDSNKKPAALLIAQYNTAIVAAYLRGGNLAATTTLAQLKAMTGTLTVTVDGVAKTSSAINLNAATSFSNAATIIQAAFTAPGFTVSFDSVSGAFVLTSATSGSASTISVGSGTIAAGLRLTTATGAVTSQGAPVATPGGAMAAITAATQNFASFTTLFDPDAGAGNAAKLAFAAWTNSTGNRYLYVPWDTDVTPTQSTAAAASLGYLLDISELSGTATVYAPSWDKAVFALGTGASIDFDEANGRTTFAFRRQGGLTADVTDQTTKDNLQANGYNFYGAYGTANDEFRFFYPGSVSGPYLWIDSYLNQIQLNNALQLALINLLLQMKSIPYNETGRGYIKAACQDPINAALNFGSIRAGIILSEQQASAVDAQAGLKISQTITNLGYYLQVLDATAQVRAARASPPCKFFYADGQSVQQIDLASIAIQ